MKTYLITVAVGPVQEFIAAARKFRDLWFGSYLLSELSKQAARSLHEQGAELIFPAPENIESELKADSEMKVPNKLLACIACDQPPEIFETVKKDVFAYWKEELAEKTIRHNRGDINLELFNRQIDDFLEIYGAWTPLIDKEYKDCRKRADRILAARKSLRDFRQSPSVFQDNEKKKGGLPKSSLDGNRESVLKDEFRKSDKQRHGIKEYEELDALGWIKRHGKQFKNGKEQFPKFDSLSDIAADPFCRSVLREKGESYGLLQKIISVLKTPELNIPRSKMKSEDGDPLEGYSAQFLYQSRVNQALGKTGELSAEQDDINRLLKELYRSTGEKQGPLPYMAILVGDGDRMGATIDNINEISIHQSFSRSLDRFARKCDSIVSDHQGCLIYSGGDDVLATLPLDKALDCADQIRISFQKQMETALAGTAIDIPTFSIGMVIVHHLRPMGVSLQLARQAERLAKDNGRDALAVILDKRGGAPIEISGHWNDRFYARLCEWVRYHCDELMPDKLGYELRHLSKELGNTLKWVDGKPANALAYEFQRVLKRKKSDGGRTKMDSAHLEQIIKTACSLNQLDALANELILTRIIAQARKQAGGN